MTSSPAGRAEYPDVVVSALPRSLDYRGVCDRIAVKFTPTTPYRRAVRSLVVPSKHMNRDVMRGSTNPAA